MYEYYGKELTGFAITSGIVGASIAIATVNVFYIRHIKTNPNKKSRKKRNIDPTSYVPATDELSNAEEEVDEASYVAPTEAAINKEKKTDEAAVAPSERLLV